MNNHTIFMGIVFPFLILIISITVIYQANKQKLEGTSYFNLVFGILTILASVLLVMILTKTVEFGPIGKFNRDIELRFVRK